MNTSFNPYEKKSITKRELYYKTRSVFKRNEKFLQQQNNEQPILIQNLNQQENIMNQIQYKLRKAKNISYEKHFRTSAGDVSQKCQTSYIKARNRLSLSHFNVQSPQNGDINQGHQSTKGFQFQQNYFQACTDTSYSPSKNVIEKHVPQICFDKFTPRKIQSSMDNPDDERRYNNFSSYKVKQGVYTPDICKRPFRDGKSMKVPMHDLYYQQANNQYLKCVYQDRLKCIFDYDREQKDPYLSKIDNVINGVNTAKNVEENQENQRKQIQKALEKISPRIKHIINMRSMTGRDAPSSFMAQTFRQSENQFYKTKNEKTPHSLKYRKLRGQTIQ